MALSDEQFSYRGLVFGSGTTFFLNSAQGFFGFEVRSGDSDQPRGDGAIRGLDYVAPRTIDFEFAIIEVDDPLAAGGTSYESQWASLREAFAPSRDEDFDLVFKRPGMPEQFVKARAIQLVRTEEYKRYNRVGFPPVVLRAVDPRIYATELRSGSIPVYAASQGGFDMPVVNYPIDFTGGSQQDFVANNSGEAESYPVVQFFGPTTGTCTGVTLTNTTNGDVLQVTTSILSGQTLKCDMEAAVTGANRLVISLDGSSRYGSWVVPRKAFALSPGSNNLRFQVSGTATAMMCNMQWRDTWID